MQFCYADLEQLIIISPSRQDHDRIYQEKIVNVNYVINLLSSLYDTNTQFLLDDILYFKFKISHICCHNFYMCTYCLSCCFYKLDVESVFKRIWKKMLILFFFLCIFPEHLLCQFFSYILFHLTLYNVVCFIIQQMERPNHYNFKFLVFIISLCNCGKSIFNKSNCCIVRYTPLIVGLPLMNSMQCTLRF